MENINYKRKNGLEIWSHGEHPGLEPEWFVPFLVDDPPVEPLKDSHSRKIYLWSSPGGRVYVKLFTYATSGRRGDWLREMFDWKKHGRDQFKRVLHLEKNGFNVARPLFALEKKENWFKRRSLVVLKELEGTALPDYLREVSSEEAYKFFERSLKTIQRMHALNIAYGDTKLDNLLVDREGKLAWTDYDDLKINYRWWPSKLRDLRRHLQSWLKLTQKADINIDADELITKYYKINPRTNLTKKFIVHRTEKQL